MKTKRLLATGSALLAGGLLISGCSTVDGLLAPNTEQNSILVSASNDVVLDNGHKILNAPLCEKGDDVDVAFSCSGKTQDGEDIKVVVPPFTDDKGVKVTKDVLIGTMTVSVGSEEVYSGEIQKVINKNMYHPGAKP